MPIANSDFSLFRISSRWYITSLRHNGENTIGHSYCTVSMHFVSSAPSASNLNCEMDSTGKQIARLKYTIHLSVESGVYVVRAELRSHVNESWLFKNSPKMYSLEAMFQKRSLTRYLRENTIFTIVYENPSYFLKIA